MRLRTLYRFLSYAAAFAFATAPLTTSASQPHVLRFTLGVGITTLDPLLATNSAILGLSQLTMAHFVRFGPHKEFIPELLTEIPTRENGGIAADFKTITFHLRHGVKWSDGVPFDADDVAYTMRVVKNKDNLITQHEAWDRLESFEEPDKFTIVAHLDHPYVPFVGAFFSSEALSCVLPAHILGASTNINTAPYNALPIGIGPFRYTAFRRGDAIEMEANPYYFGKHPKLQKIVYSLVTDSNTIFAQLQTGELDLWATADANFVDRIRAKPSMHVEIVPSPYMSGVFFQTQHPVVADAAVRRALRLATDRKRLFELAAKGIGVLAESVVPPSSYDFADLQRAPYDPDAANKALDAAGWARGADGIRAKNGVRLSVSVAIPAGYGPSATFALLLQAEWKAVGVEAQPKPVESTQFFAPASSGGTLMSGNFDAALLSFSVPLYADVANAYSCESRAPSGLNMMRYCNPDLDRRVVAYAQTYDPVQRAAIARSVQTTIDEDCPVIVNYSRSFAYAYSKRLGGFKPQIFGAYDDIADADVTE